MSNESLWQAANQQYLMAQLERIYRNLQRQIEVQSTGLVSSLKSSVSNPVNSDRSHCSALETLAKKLNLSSFEQDVLLLCIGVEVDANFRVLCGQLQPDLKHSSPTFSLAGLVLEQCHWEAFTPQAPLRHWQLIELGAGSTLMTSPLRIDERILHYVMGISGLDDRLCTLVKPIHSNRFLVKSHQENAQEIVTLWQDSSFANVPTLQLCGADSSSQSAIAAEACQRLHLQLYSLSSHALPTNLADLQQVIKLWQREAMLNAGVLLFHWHDRPEQDAAQENAIALFLESITSPLIIMSRDRRAMSRSSITLEIDHPTTQEQFSLWHHFLENSQSALDGSVELLVSQFNLSANQIQLISQKSLKDLNHQQVSLFPLLWGTCRQQARPQLDDLAQRIDAGEDWEDLILADAQKQILREILAHVKQRSKVYEQWGFANKGRRGLGITALFSGLSGTGKTMAAGVLARELNLDLYRIDLSSIVSKYIGETEKNLRRVFDAAEAGGVILLFDEADALFGKRSDVRDSHDRYANMEVSYLLQRMEAYRGLAILTTNLKESIDPAFLRRIRFIVKFPFPEYDDRIKIWQHIFPQNTPTFNLNFKKLAKLNIAGGNIRNIAMNAAFQAADEGQAVTMVHLLKASQSEYLKLERSLTSAEIKGWIDDSLA